MAEKRVESTKQIFEYLTDFEILSKDIKFHEMIQLDAADHRNTYTVEDIIEIIVKMSEKLLRETATSQQQKPKLEQLARALNEKNEVASQEFQKHTQLVNESESLVKSLRENLQNSNSVLVESFCKARKSLEQSLDQQNQVLKTHACLKLLHFERDDLKLLIENVFEVCLRSIEWPKFDYMPFVKKEINIMSVIPRD